MRLPRGITAWGSRNTVLPEAELSCTRPATWLAAPTLKASTGRPLRSAITVSWSIGAQRRNNSCSLSRRSARAPASWRRKPPRAGLARSATRPPSSRQKCSRCSSSGRVRSSATRAVVTGRSSGPSIWRRSRRAAARVVASSSSASPAAVPPLAQSCTVVAISATP